MMAALCPSGATSTVFALLTSVQMAGSTLAGSLSSALTHALEVRLGDYSNLGTLTVATAAIRLCTLLCVGLVPAKTTRTLEAETAGSGRLLSSVVPATPSAFVEAGSSLTDGDQATSTSGSHNGQQGFEFVELADGASNNSDANGEVFVGTQPPQRHPRWPYGAMLLLSMIAASLTWSLASMFSHL